MNQAGRRCQRSTASSAPNRRWHWWSSSHSRVLGWALDQAASATHPHSPTARWSELTPSLHFTFRHYNHPQHQPQQSSEWYSYSSSAITPLLYTLDRFWFTSVGRQTFVFCAFFFFFFSFYCFSPPGASRSIIRILLCYSCGRLSESAISPTLCTPYQCWLLRHHTQKVIHPPSESSLCSQGSMFPALYGMGEHRKKGPMFPTVAGWWTNRGMG